MTMYLIMSNGKEKSSHRTLKNANKEAKKRAIQTGSGHEVLRSLHVFEGGTGKLLR